MGVNTDDFRNGFTAIRMTIRIAGDAPAEKLRRSWRAGPTARSSSTRSRPGPDLRRRRPPSERRSARRPAARHGPAPASIGEEPAMYPTYDAVVVGARCAGSATAMLLARAGMRVLLLDRAHPGRDTLSTHALMRAGVAPAGALGVCSTRSSRAGTPPVTGMTFHYADGSREASSSRSRCTRRGDRARHRAARRRGRGRRRGPARRRRHRACARDGGGRVTGVQLRVRGHDDPAVVARRAARSARTGSARRSPRAVGAPTTWQGAAASRPRLRLLAGRADPALRVVLPARRRRRGHPDQRRAGLRLGGVAGRPVRRAPTWREAFAAVLRADGARKRRAPARRPPTGTARSAASRAARLGCGRPPERDGRSSATPATFKDPLTAHGITDALRDAELLARAAVDGSSAAFDGYERTRDALTVPLLEVAERIVGYGWDTPEIRELLRAESAVMRRRSRFCVRWTGRSRGSARPEYGTSRRTVEPTVRRRRRAPRGSGGMERKRLSVRSVHPKPLSLHPARPLRPRPAAERAARWVVTCSASAATPSRKLEERR